MPGENATSKTSVCVSWSVFLSCMQVVLIDNIKGTRCKVDPIGLQSTVLVLFGYYNTRWLITTNLFHIVLVTGRARVTVLASMSCEDLKGLSGTCFYLFFVVVFVF